MQLGEVIQRELCTLDPFSLNGNIIMKLQSEIGTRILT